MDSVVHSALQTPMQAKKCRQQPALLCPRPSPPKCPQKRQRCASSGSACAAVLTSTQERIIKAVDLARVRPSHLARRRRLLTPHGLQTVVHYGWIPFIIYVGYTRSNPQPSLIK